MGSALPPGGKKDLASQQEISNHFSDTKATGMRCRSEEEGLRWAERNRLHELAQAHSRGSGPKQGAIPSGHQEAPARRGSAPTRRPGQEGAASCGWLTARDSPGEPSLRDPSRAGSAAAAGDQLSGTAGPSPKCSLSGTGQAHSSGGCLWGQGLSLRYHIVAGTGPDS